MDPNTRILAFALVMILIIGGVYSYRVIEESASAEQAAQKLPRRLEERPKQKEAPKPPEVYEYCDNEDFDKLAICRDSECVKKTLTPDCRDCVTNRLGAFGSRFRDCASREELVSTDNHRFIWDRLRNPGEYEPQPKPPNPIDINKGEFYDFRRVCESSFRKQGGIYIWDDGTYATPITGNMLTEISWDETEDLLALTYAKLFIRVFDKKTGFEILEISPEGFKSAAFDESGDSLLIEFDRTYKKFDIKTESYKPLKLVRQNDTRKLKNHCLEPTGVRLRKGRVYLDAPGQSVLVTPSRAKELRSALDPKPTSVKGYTYEVEDQRLVKEHIKTGDVQRLRDGVTAVRVSSDGAFVIAQVTDEASEQFFVFKTKLNGAKRFRFEQSPKGRSEVIDFDYADGKLAVLTEHTISILETTPPVESLIHEPDWIKSKRRKADVLEGIELRAQDHRTRGPRSPIENMAAEGVDLTPKGIEKLFKEIRSGDIVDRR